MSPLEWKQEFSVGNPAVDHEHQELIELVNALHGALTSSADRNEVIAAFGELFRSISAHFALEEHFMREHEYDQLTQHKADHERLLDDLRDIMDGYVEQDDTVKGTAAVLAERVEAWFATHFKTHDARLHARLGDHPH